MHRKHLPKEIICWATKEVKIKLQKNLKEGRKIEKKWKNSKWWI
jgi:hypothetical protein